MRAGDFEYRVNDKLHRAVGPAIRYKEGDWYWYLYGYFHRYYGPCSGYGCWCIHGRTIK